MGGRVLAEGLSECVVPETRPMVRVSSKWVFATTTPDTSAKLLSVEQHASEKLSSWSCCAGEPEPRPWLL